MLVGLVVALTIGEIVCRLAGWDGRPDVDPERLAKWRKNKESSIYRAASDPLLLYEYRPDYIADGRRWTESAGILRATDVPRTKPAGMFRIAVLGDSVSTMLALRRKTGGLPWPDLMEEHLKGTGKAVEVLNFGTDGYGTLQEARLLETKVLDYDPDLVLVQYCFNDAATSFTPAIWFVADDRPTSWLFSHIASRLRREPVDEFNPRHSRFAPFLGPTTPGALAWWREMYDPGSVGWRRVETGFRRIAAAAGKRSIPVVLVVFPLLLDAAERNAFVEEIHRRVIDLGRDHGFRVVDLLPAYAEHPVRDLMERPDRDVYHPGPLGHRVAARMIAADLEETYLR